MLRRFGETIIDMFRLGKGYIKADEVYMYIHYLGKDVKFFYEMDGEKYDLNDNRIEFDAWHYLNLSIFESERGGIVKNISEYVKLNDAQINLLKQYAKYLQKGYRFGNHLEDKEAILASKLQNMYNVTPWHMYNKNRLLQIENNINQMLQNNEHAVLQNSKNI